MKTFLKRLSCGFMICFIGLGVIGCDNSQETVDVSEYIIDKNEVSLRLQYNREAPVTNTEHEDEATWYSDISWERESLPIGNGYFGANVFGRTEIERIQISEKTMTNPHHFAPPNGICKGGLNNFSETFIDFGHTKSGISNYYRYLDLETAISGVEYNYNGVKYSREYFTSYPDKALVIRLDADTSGALSFTLRPTIPFEQDYMEEPGDGLSKHGSVTSTVVNGVGQIELSGKMGYYDIDFMGLYKVYTKDGVVSAGTCVNQYGETDGTIVVSDATSAYIVVTLGTDYELSSEIFTSDTTLNNSLANAQLQAFSTTVPTFKTTIEDTREKVEGEMGAIEELTAGLSFDGAYSLLKERHMEDYSELFGRVSLDLDFDPEDITSTTPDLLFKYRNGKESTYLETLLFQYGRYMLVASSRIGTMPAHLQGAWNTYNSPAWSSGYWHNVNVQMNYWPAFSTNLAETFEAYVEYNQAYMEAAEAYADLAIKTGSSSENYGKDGGNGWVMGVAATSFNVSSDTSPGNLGFTTQMFWDYYEYTQDKALLEEVVYPVLYSAAQFITKVVVEDENGNYLVEICDSPEQYVNGSWYYTSGTTYAQSFAYLNNYNLLLAAKELGIDVTDSNVLTSEENAVLKTVLEQIDKYDPIVIGLSGQVKEFREEKYYGNLGEWQHRHMAHLSGLVPGNIINSTTPAWIDAAKVVLTERGDADGVGWARAYQLCLWARAFDGNKAHEILGAFINDHMADNLWDLYDAKYNRCFQIEANFGATAGMAEMLLQSSAEGYVEPLAALPEAWDKGSYTGLVARGNFEVSASWENGVAKTFNILSKSGGKVSIKYPSITGAVVRDESGKLINYTVEDNNVISFDTEEGKTYVIYGFKAQNKINAPTNFTYRREDFNEFNFSWDSVEGAAKYNVYVAVESQSDYTLIGSTTNTNYIYLPNTENLNSRMTFVVTAVGADSFESGRTLCYYNPIEIIDGITIDGIRDELYGTNIETVLLDGDRSYNISAVKTESGVFIYAQGIFNTNANDIMLNAWSDKTNFEFKLNGGKQSYVNVLKQFGNVTHFAYDVKYLPDTGKYQHTVEIFVDKELISNWSSTEDVQINYAWKTPGENAYIISDVLDDRYKDWNTDWHSYHRLGCLSTSYVPLQANLFITNNGLVESSVEEIDDITIDGIKEESYGMNSETVLLDDDRSYNISTVKTDRGVYIYAQGIFNTNVTASSNQGWANKTNFEFKLNGGKQSYVNVINESNGVTNFNYKVELLPNGKYQHTVEIFVDKTLISNWSNREDVQINYAWKTPGENAHITSDLLDSRHGDWNTDWHSYHRLGGLTTYYVPLQANLFVSTSGLKSNDK